MSTDCWAQSAAEARDQVILLREVLSSIVEADGRSLDAEDDAEDDAGESESTEAAAVTEAVEAAESTGAAESSEPAGPAGPAETAPAGSAEEEAVDAWSTGAAQDPAEDPTRP